MRNAARVIWRAPRIHEVGRRLSWGVADQAISSPDQLHGRLWVARFLGPIGLGAFSIAFATYLIALNASRGLATDALLVRYSGVSLEKWRGAVTGCTGSAIAVEVVAGAACVIGSLSSHPWSTWLAPRHDDARPAAAGQLEVAFSQRGEVETRS